MSLGSRSPGANSEKINILQNTNDAISDNYEDSLPNQQDQLRVGRNNKS